MVEAGFEIASHCWRWIDYQYVAPEAEREHIGLAVEAIEHVSPNTRARFAEQGGFLYDADSYADELPY